MINEEARQEVRWKTQEFWDDINSSLSSDDEKIIALTGWIRCCEQFGLLTYNEARSVYWMLNSTNKCLFFPGYMWMVKIEEGEDFEGLYEKISKELRYLPEDWPYEYKGKLYVLIMFGPLPEDKAWSISDRTMEWMEQREEVLNAIYEDGRSSPGEKDPRMHLIRIVETPVRINRNTMKVT